MALRVLSVAYGKIVVIGPFHKGRGKHSTNLYGKRYNNVLLNSKIDGDFVVLQFFHYFI